MHADMFTTKQQKSTHTHAYIVYMHAYSVTTQQLKSSHTHACVNQHARIVYIALILFDTSWKEEKKNWFNQWIRRRKSTTSVKSDSINKQKFDEKHYRSRRKLTGGLLEAKFIEWVLDGVTNEYLTVWHYLLTAKTNSAAVRQEKLNKKQKLQNDESGIRTHDLSLTNSTRSVNPRGVGKSTTAGKPKVKILDIWTKLTYQR